MKILVTGGAGYIGSVVTYKLIEQGNDVTVIDDLSNGFATNVHPDAKFIEGSILDKEKLSEALDGVEAVIHLAAKIRVEEGEVKPDLYRSVNVDGTLMLLELCKSRNINKFIFASTAAVYGDPEDYPVTENSRVAPVNIYGKTKLEIDQYLSLNTTKLGICSISFRFFNVGGALKTSEGKWLKIKHEGATHLIPLTLQCSPENPLQIYGNDWPTEDGTPARDYVHVVDIAEALISSLTKFDLPVHSIINLGTSNGSTVLQVAKTAEKVLNKKINYVFASRRQGDSFALVTSHDKATKILGWKPKFNLESILSDANSELIANK
jgi:UDP-glucose 4-epimerase